LLVFFSLHPLPLFLDVLSLFLSLVPLALGVRGQLWTLTFSGGLWLVHPDRVELLKLPLPWTLPLMGVSIHMRHFGQFRELNKSTHGHIVDTLGPILTVWNASGKRKTQVALWAVLRRYRYFTGG
jgi:hypothetical protein